MQRLKDAFFQTLGYATTAPTGFNPVCVQCLQPVTRDYITSGTEGLNLTFCTQRCCYAYWEEYGKYGKIPPATAMTEGPRICGLPGCHKPCYVEGNGKVHDYCGRTHAQQAGAITSSNVAQGGGGRSTRYTTQNSGGSYRSHTFSGWSDQTGPILFYNRGEPYYEFTNFHQAVVKIDGKDWLTTEHYFQAQKFVGTPLVGTIRLMERPREAFDKSRDPRYSHWRRSDWEEVKEKIMFKALQAKFTQHEDLKRMLLSTKDRRLVEHSPYDSYWGDGGDGSGKNRLGELLMRLRKDLKPRPAPPAPTPPLLMHSDSPSPPTSVHSHLQQDVPLHTKSSSPPKQQHKWYTPPSITPEHSSKQSDDLAEQSVPQQSQLQQSNAVLGQMQTEPGGSVPRSTVATFSQTPPVTKLYTVTFSYSSVVSGANRSSKAVTTVSQPYQSNPQSAVISHSQVIPQLTMVQPSQPNPQSTMAQPSQPNPQSTMGQPSQPNPPSTMAQPSQPNPPSTMAQPSQPNPPSTMAQPSQPNPQLTMVQSSQSSQQPTLQSHTPPPGFQFPQPLAQPAPAYTLLNNTTVTSAPQQLAGTATTGNLMGQYDLTYIPNSGGQLTRNTIGQAGCQATPTSGHLVMPAHVQTPPPANPTPSSQAEEDPTPMDTGN